MNTGINKRGVKMEEENRRKEKEIKLIRFRIIVCEAKKADADRKWNAAEKSLILEQEKLSKLENARDDKSWAQAVKDGEQGLVEETG